MDKMTPAMKQYFDMKGKYPDCLILFRMGDFYETFFEDAKIASKVLNITLTKRGKNNGQDVPLAGIPYHALQNYLGKLVKHGLKVAICEQIEDPKFAKGVVKRNVIRVITPGTLIDESLLDEKSNNYIMSLNFADKIGVSALDISTGEFICTDIPRDKLLNEIQRYNPAEILVPESFGNSEIVKNLKSGFLVNAYRDIFFNGSVARLCEHFKVATLQGFGLAGSEPCISSAGALINYVYDTQKTNLDYINQLRYYQPSDFLVLDNVTLRNLEIVQNLRDMKSGNTLLEVIDKTLTPMSAREIKKWLIQPLIDINKINARLDSVEEISSDIMTREELSEILRKVSDIERIISRINYGNCNARDLIAFRNSLKYLPRLKNAINNAKTQLLRELAGFNPLEDIFKTINDSISDDPPFTLREGGLIKENYSKDLDDIRSLARNAKQFISDLEENERESSGIKSLKVRFNNVFGYYIEVTKANLHLVPKHYIRKQTTVNGERFITNDLKEFEEQVLSAEDKIRLLEYELFQGIVESIAVRTVDVQNTARAVAKIDVLNSLAFVAVSRNYSKPSVHNGFEIVLESSRHPVLELLEQSFVPNNLEFSNDNRTMIITGPNMAGKSTLMRQVALICILAQMGSFVPAKSARISILDRIFSRVGAQDDLSRGQSTFMVEMTETANILNSATDKSLIIMDEIGRGTSTFDGVSIAWSVAEYLHNKIKAKTMFATHYHVMSKLSKYPGVKNYNMAVKEMDDEIIFLRKLVEGGTDKSYGIHVAKLAGMPKEVIVKAKEIQFKLEDSDRMQEQIVVEKRSKVKDDEEIITFTKSVQKKLDLW